MSKVDALKEALALAEKEEIDAENSRILENARKFVGTCRSTHTFKRLPTKAKELHLRKVIDVGIFPGGKLYYECRTITFMYDIDSHSLTFTIGTSKHDTPYPYWLGSFCHEISEEVFDNVFNGTQVHADTYFDKIRGLFTQSEYITVGDSIKEDSRMELLSKYHEFVDVPGVYNSECCGSISELLGWHNHPYLFRHNKLLKTKESFSIIKDIADKLYRSAITNGGSIADRDLPRAKVLSLYYNSIINDV